MGMYRGNRMKENQTVLCGASAYEQKYYFNQEFSALPQTIKEDLQILCVTFTEEIGGIMTMFFDEEGNLKFETEALDSDGMYDEIGGALKIKKICQERQEFLLSLETYYRVVFLGEELEEKE
ncbi:MAG TPA: DUF6145 family protein [Lachnospiraceae bacterium]